MDHNITLKDACRVWLNLPDWIRFYEEIDNPMFLGTLSVEGDEKVRMQMYEALGLHRLKVTVTGDGIDKHGSAIEPKHHRDYFLVNLREQLAIAAKSTK